MMEISIHLLIPDLFPPSLASPSTLTLPSLGKLLSHAYLEQWPQSTFAETLFALFSLPSQPPLPIAPLTRLTDSHDSGDKIWLRADPVYLQANMDQVFLFDASLLQITQNEANQLINHLNDYFEQDNLLFSAPTPQRWYLQLAELPAVEFTPLPQVIGRPLQHCLPMGEESLFWRKLLNETQTILHQSAINQQREIQQKLPINSVWFWGMGQLPAPPPTRWRQVWTEESLTQGLAQLTNTDISLPTTGETFLKDVLPGEHLLTLLMPDNYSQQNEAWLLEMEKNWFAPFWQALKKRQLDTLIIYPGDNRTFCITRNQTRHWWRKHRNWQWFARQK